jgi:signal transduction histidine kinase
MHHENDIDPVMGRRHRPWGAAEGVVNSPTQTLPHPAIKATASSRHLKTGMSQRRAAEAALRKSTKHCSRLLAESRRLQKHLQQQAREALSVQEEERHKLSHQLQDDIAQTLLAIEVRLLALKTAAAANPASLAKEIASTQRLVVKSSQALNRFARALDVRQRA